jgi:hypothetical protein
MIEAKGQRLIVSINDLRRASPDRAKALLTNSFEEVSAFQRYFLVYRMQGITMLAFVRYQGTVIVAFLVERSTMNLLVICFLSQLAHVNARIIHFFLLFCYV